MNGFDKNVEMFFNDFAHRWVAFDKGLTLLDHGLFKGGVVMVVIWWLWFRTPSSDRTRGVLVCTVFAALAAIVVARGLGGILPFRDRPIVASGFDYRTPYALDTSGLESWSSFPSDHAVLFFALAAGIFRVHRPLGIVVAVYSTVFIMIPRLILGFHWPTDVLVGSLLGVGIGWSATSPTVVDRVVPPFRRFIDKYPAAFYATAFLLTYQIADTFSDLRLAAHYVLHTAKGLL